MSKTRWGILGTGGIAKSFATGLSFVEDAELVAVGSRSAESAEAFGEKFNIPHRHATYEALVADPDVEVIYVSSPHLMHHEHAMLCLKAGKHVLCEKAFTINAAEAADLINYAREHKLFLMEAMWTRFLPLFVRIRSLLAEGVIGQVQGVNANFSFGFPFDAKHRLYNPELGGGALLDAGIYPVSMASMILGTPSEISSFARICATGVDEQAAIIQRYEGGQLALLDTSVSTASPQLLVIRGSAGYITVDPWLRGTKLSIHRSNQEPEVIEEPIVGNGYNYEAAEVGRCIREGKLESEIMPLDETLSIMQTLDKIRAPWGFKYPTEQ